MSVLKILINKTKRLGELTLHFFINYYDKRSVAEKQKLKLADWFVSCRYTGQSVFRSFDYCHVFLEWKPLQCTHGGVCSFILSNASVRFDYSVHSMYSDYACYFIFGAFLSLKTLFIQKIYFENWIQKEQLYAITVGQKEKQLYRTRQWFIWITRKFEYFSQIVFQWDNASIGLLCTTISVRIISSRF